MSGSAAVRKPPALRKGSRLAVVAPASPADRMDVIAGVTELRRLGFEVDFPPEREPDGYFAASAETRAAELTAALSDPGVDGLVGLRGGYGSTYLLDDAFEKQLGNAKVLVGYSDLSSLQVFLCQKRGWVTFYGPMAAAGFDHGANCAPGYDEESFLNAVTRTQSGWSIPLEGETLRAGKAEGRVLGGCLTLLQTTLGTPWELDTRGAILVLEDVGMKPYQVDRALMHWLQAGKFREVRGIVLGDFPGCEPAKEDSPTVREIAARLLQPLGVPVVYGAPLGHTKRAMLTVPLGVMGRLVANGDTTLEILEPAVT